MMKKELVVMKKLIQLKDELYDTDKASDRFHILSAQVDILWWVLFDRSED